MSDHLAGFIADLLEAVNAHDLERVACFYSPEYEGIDVAERAPHHGPQGIRENLQRYFEAFPDLHISADELLVQGDRAALAWTGRATHLGRLLNIPPTGRQVTLRGVAILTVQDNQVRRLLQVWDVAGLLRTIGLLPEL